MHVSGFGVSHSLDASLVDFNPISHLYTKNTIFRFSDHHFLLSRHADHYLIRVYPTGFAYVGGACVVNKRLEKVNSVAIIEDTGGFSGIIVAAHEVGHL